VNATSHSRRQFIAGSTSAGALLAAANYLPFRLPFLGEAPQDSRIASTPIVDKGFASVRKIGNGLYATISDTSKGLQTMCNGGFLVGRDGALLVEGFVSPAGAAFQIETGEIHNAGSHPRRAGYALPLRPLDGNSVYGAHGIRCGACGDGEKNLFRVWAVADHGEKRGYGSARKDADQCKVGTRKKTFAGRFGYARKSIRDGECLPTEPAESSDRSREGADEA